LSSLTTGQIRYLGVFNIDPATGKSNGLTNARLEYGSLVSDPKRGRIVIGPAGGHTMGFTNDFGAFTGRMPFDLLYPADADSLISDSTTRTAQQIPGSLVYADTNHIVATHGFTASCIRGDRLYSMTNGGSLPISAPMPFSYCDFTTNLWTPIPLVCPWYYCASAEVDPVSGKIFVLGSKYSGSIGGSAAWLFDPDTNALSAAVGCFPFANSTVPPDIFYDQANDRFLCIQGMNATVYQFKLDRTNFANTKFTQLAVGGTLPAGFGQNSVAVSSGA
jgi:hypothetical protein